MANHETTRAYIACLSSYNAGEQHGAWFDLAQYDDVDTLKRDIAIMLVGSKNPNVHVTCPACNGAKPDQFFCRLCNHEGTVDSGEEYAFHDYDGAALTQFGEYPDLEQLLAFVHLVQEHGDAFLAYVSHVGLDTALEEDAYTDAYHSTCDNVRAFAEEHLEGSGMLATVPKELIGYIDYEAYGRDLALNGTFAFVEYGSTTYVFNN